MPELPFQERLQFVIRWLQRRRAYVAAAVMRLGRPRFTRCVCTAAIVARGQEVTLYFNPDFCRAIDNPELAGLLTHEALHFVLAHQKRASRIQNQRDRFYFSLAADAVINDLIKASFPEMKLPATPVTGVDLIGEDASQMSAEQVFRLLRDRARQQGPDLEQKLTVLELADEHWLWSEVEVDLDNGPPDELGLLSAPQTDNDLLDYPESQSDLPLPGNWTTETSALLVQLGDGLPAQDPCWGTVAAGMDRPAQPAPHCRRNLARFLQDSVTAPSTYETVWSLPNRKLTALYPRVILPTYQTKPKWNVLLAIDASGSVPERFIAVAMAFASKPLRRTRIKVISFDTAWYECDPGTRKVKGGGGTRAQAVEDYIHHRGQRYPDRVFLFTDGFTPAPLPLYPERWTWLLPPWGSTANMPSGSRAVYFEAAEIPAAF